MESNHNMIEKNWELLAKSFYDRDPNQAENTNSADAKDLPGADEMQKLVQMKTQVDIYFDLKKYPVEPAWEKVSLQIHAVSQKKTGIRKMFSNPLIRLAAAIIVGAALLFSGYEVFINPGLTSKMLEVTAANQLVNTITLPDGSLVSLNSNTKLKYPKKFGKNIREVSIEGEAFFEVKPNKNKPFIIHAGNAQIKVLGTSFDVNAYPELKKVEVIVETGKVQVVDKTSETKLSNELILIQGEKGTLDCSSNALLKTTNSDPNFLAWKTHNLYFKATSLNEVIGNLEKVYKVNIRLASPALNDLRLTAQFNDYSLDFILKVIESTFNVEARNINGKYIIKARS